MAAHAEIYKQFKSENSPNVDQERLLTEVRHLQRNRLADGSIDSSVEASILDNLMTAVQEGSMPYAVTPTRQEYVRQNDGSAVLKWMGKTAVQNATGGLVYHVHKEMHDRVHVEIDEAHYLENDLKPGVIKLFISPRMSHKDASREVAEYEHMAEDDAIRASWLETDNLGEITHLETRSLLVRDIPLEAWVNMLADPKNMFGTALHVEDRESALAVMKIHRQLEVPAGTLPGGPVDLIRAVLPYISDPAAQIKVSESLNKFETVNQRDLAETAQHVAQRWLNFEKELAESLDDGCATPAVTQFIHTFSQKWNEQALAVINGSFDGHNYRMNDELAALLEDCNRNMLWVSAGAASGNERIIKQMDHSSYIFIKQQEFKIQQLQAMGVDYYHLEAQKNQRIAEQNVTAGGGCGGESKGAFDASGETSDMPGFIKNEESSWKLDPKSWKPGLCRVKDCKNRDKLTEVGPCSVCRDCQQKFDSPTTASSVNLAEGIASLFRKLATQDSHDFKLAA